MKQLKRHLFILLLLLVMVFGYLFCEPLSPIASLSWLKWSIVFVTLFVMALPIEFSSLQRAFTRPTAVLIACLTSYLFIPLLMWPLSRLAGPVLGPGLMMVAAVPVTLASASVWTRRAGGDDSISMLATIITNGICFVVTPFWVYWAGGLVIERELFLATIFNLLIFVVVPMAVAQITRAIFTPIADWSMNYKPLLSVIAQGGVLSMILIGMIKTGIQLTQGESTIGIPDLLTTLVVCAVVHLVAFGFAIRVSRMVGLSDDARIAVGLAGSQKTLMIGLSAATSLGVTIIPCVIFQLFQLTVDTFIADWWKKRFHKPPEEEIAN